MPDPITAQPRPGILVVVKAGEDKRFVDQVTQALQRIDSKPVGRQLLQSIARHPAQPSAAGETPFVIKIVPASSVRTTKLCGLRSKQQYTAGSVTKSFNEQRASDGSGSRSALYWNPAETRTPDGERPSFISLAHELVHAMHNLDGTAKLTSGAAGRRDDEMQVTGLAGHETKAISENRIRLEHGLPLRTRYHGLAEAPEDAPAPQAFGLPSP